MAFCTGLRRSVLPSGSFRTAIAQARQLLGLLVVGLMWLGSAVAAQTALAGDASIAEDEGTQELRSEPSPEELALVSALDANIDAALIGVEHSTDRDDMIVTATVGSWRKLQETILGAGETPPAEGWFADAGSQKLALWARLVDRHPESALGHYQLAMNCVASGKDNIEICNDAQRLAFSEADRNSLVPWMLLAARAERKGQTAERDRLLERAARAHRIDSHMAELIGPVRKFIAAQMPAGDPALRQLLADGYALSTTMFDYFPDYQDWVLLCGAPRQNSLRSEHQRELCFRIGSIALESSDYFLDQHIAIALLEANSASEEDTSWVRQQRGRMRTLETAGVELLPHEQSPQAMNEQDRHLLGMFFEDLLAHGEVDASRKLILRSGHDLDAWIAANCRGDDCAALTPPAPLPTDIEAAVPATLPAATPPH